MFERLQSNWFLSDIQSGNWEWRVDWIWICEFESIWLREYFCVYYYGLSLFVSCVLSIAKRKRLWISPGSGSQFDKDRKNCRCQFGDAIKAKVVSLFTVPYLICQMDTCLIS